MPSLIDLRRRIRAVKSTQQITKAMKMIAASRLKRAQDRVVGLDTLYTNTMLLLLTFGIRSGDALYFEAALIIALLGFVGTVALAKFLLRGEVIE